MLVLACAGFLCCLSRSRGLDMCIGGPFALMLLVGVVAGLSEDVQLSRNDPENIFHVGDVISIKNSLLVPTTRIINGQLSIYGSRPYHCGLHTLENGMWSPTCGAVIYNHNTILTAAHCVVLVPPNTVRVRCGDLDLSTPEPFEVTRAIVNITIHPGWKHNGSLGFPNDLALMKVESPLVFNDYVNTLPIADNTTPIPTNCTLVGWGRTESGESSLQLREVNIQRISNRKCNEFWTSLINSGHVCFLNNGETDGNCNGDSGSASICGDFLVGVTSWGSVDCPMEYPSVHTRLSYFRAWIQNNAFYF